MINRLPEQFKRTGRSSTATRDPKPEGDGRSDLAATVEQLVKEYPVACLASAFIVGVTIAWWIKRR